MFVNTLWQVLQDLAPWLLIGAAAAGVLHVTLPSDLVRRRLRGTRGVLGAVAIGVPLPLCSCGVIPAAVGLKRDGASNGASLGFLISTPQTGVDSVLVTAALLGWPLALFKVVTALVTGIVGGLLGERIDPGQAQPPASGVSGAGAGGRPGRALAHALELVRSIWRWLAFGVVVSAGLTTWVPPGALSLSGQGGVFVACLGALLISIPLYVCATSSVPIAAGLVAAGMPTSAALVFLMAGPATNLATIGTVQQIFGRRLLGVYLGTLVSASIASALLFDALLGTTPAVAVQPHVHSGGDLLLQETSATLLLLMMMAFALQEASAALKRWRLGRTPERGIVHVDGMTCSGCGSKLERALGHVVGVDSAAVSHETGLTIVTGQFEPHDVENAIREAGFQPRSPLIMESAQPPKGVTRHRDD